jgi:hypothetical protein
MGDITSQTAQNPLEDVVTVDTLQAAHPELFTNSTLSDYVVYTEGRVLCIISYCFI